MGSIFHRQVDDLQMDKLRDKVALLITSQMVASVNQDQRTSWTKNVFFLPEGLEFQSTRFPFKRQSNLLPYEDIANHFIREGYLHLFFHENSTAVLKLNISLRNFFPGIMALEEFRSSPPIAP